MHGGGGGEAIGDVEAHAVAVHGFDGRTVNLPVVAPTFRLQSGGELMVHFLGDKW